MRDGVQLLGGGWRFGPRSVGLSGAVVVVALAGCARSESPELASCPAPRLVPSFLMVDDGALDRGFAGGVSLVDLDGDGDLDLVATRGYDPSDQNRPFRFDRTMVYRNDGAGHFSHDLDNPLTSADSPNSGSTWGDVDHDGDLDGFVSVQHGKPDRFYRNLGNGRLAREELGDATTAAGSNFTSSWADIDGDGDLDLLVGGPTLEPGQPNLVYRNDAGRFVRVSRPSLENGISNPGAVLWVDVDNDGDQDFFVANSDIARMNDLAPAAVETSRIYRNDGGWQFSPIEGQGFDDPAYPAMNAAFGDIDNDGDLDLFLQANPGGDLPAGKHRLLSDHLFRNDGTGRFTLDSSFVGPAHDDINAGAAFADFDGDGDLDLVFANFDTGIFLYANDGTGRLTQVDDSALTGRVGAHAGFASGDIDGDGDHDVVVGNWGEKHEGEFITILRNESTRCGAPIRISLRDRYGALDPIGARVELLTRRGDRRRIQVREAMGQTGFRSQSGGPFLLALPQGERLDRLEIRWPGGQRQTVTELRQDGPNLIAEPAPR